jgi:hypothetical protein
MIKKKAKEIKLQYKKLLRDAEDNVDSSCSFGWKRCGNIHFYETVRFVDHLTGAWAY